jgi:hypothetical protein
MHYSEKKQKELRGSNPDASVKIRSGRLHYKDGPIFKIFEVTQDLKIREVIRTSPGATLQLTSTQERRNI